MPPSACSVAVLVFSSQISGFGTCFQISTEMEFEIDDEIEFRDTADKRWVEGAVAARSRDPLCYGRSRHQPHLVGRKVWVETIG